MLLINVLVTTYPYTYFRKLNQNLISTKQYIYQKIIFIILCSFIDEKTSIIPTLKNIFQCILYLQPVSCLLHSTNFTFLTLKVK